jgi:hypothetical protein
MLKADPLPVNLQYRQSFAGSMDWHAGAGRGDRFLESGRSDRTMVERLLAASQRILDTEASTGSDMLRWYQIPAHDNFGRYLMDLATCPENDSVTPFCRIVLPPRTGKTVIAASIVQLTGLCSVFVVPTKSLILQTARVLSTHAPGIPVGFYYSDHKNLVPNGINICTYATLQRHFGKNRLPETIRSAALVFLDEAHHVMTTKRLAAIRGAFDEKALRIAVTATPNYQDQRRLHRYFPKLIHEMELLSAIDHNLLAPTRMWLTTVDVDASVVRILAGDYEQEVLGRLMSSSPFFRAVQLFRYAESHIHIPTLITCASRQQASDLYSYLKQHRPAGRPEPGLILGDTPGEKRERLISGFNHGNPDTLIQVGVLIEGWNAPHCKLLLDLAPSLSLVRATQKYFRVMTPYRNEEARIIVMLPENMQRPPILPVDLMLPPGESYACGDLVMPRSGPPSGTPGPVGQLGHTPVKSVRIRSHVIAKAAFVRPELDPGNVSQIRRVLLSCPSFSAENPPGVRLFRRLLFKHPLFTGSGDTLLRYLSVALNNNAFFHLLIKVFPGLSGAHYLSGRGGHRGERRHSCHADFAYIWRKAISPNDNNGRPVKSLDDALHMFCGCPREVASPEDLLLIRERIEKIFELMGELDERAQWILKYRLGLFGEPQLTWDEVGRRFDISRERVRQIFFRSARLIGKKYRYRTRDHRPVVKYLSEVPEIFSIIRNVDTADHTESAVCHD